MTHTLVTRLYSWSFDGTPTVLTGRDIMTRELITTYAVYHFDIFTHTAYCVDNSAYLLDYSGGDLATTLRFTAYSRELPLPPGTMPTPALDRGKPFVACERSTALLADMSDDVLLYIFGFIGDADRGSLLRTCHKFRDVGEVRFVHVKDAERYLRTDTYIAGVPLFCRRLASHTQTLVNIFAAEAVHPCKPISAYVEMWKYFTPSPGSLRKFTYAYPHSYTPGALSYILSRFNGKYSFHIPHVLKEVLHHGKSDTALTHAVRGCAEAKIILHNNAKLRDDIIAMAVAARHADFLGELSVSSADITPSVIQRLIDRRSVDGAVYLAEVGFLPRDQVPRVFRWVAQFSKHWNLVEKFLEYCHVDDNIAVPVLERLRKQAPKQIPGVARRIDCVITAIEGRQKNK